MDGTQVVSSAFSVDSNHSKTQVLFDICLWRAQGLAPRVACWVLRTLLLGAGFSPSSAWGVWAASAAL